MTEALKLPEVTSTPQPLKPASDEAELPPLPSTLGDSNARPSPAFKESRPPRDDTSAPHPLLILFVIRLVAFTAGIALASTVLLGLVDLHSGWLKDTLDFLKDLARSKSS